MARPRRRLTVGRRPRWPDNLGILAVDIVGVRLLVPTTAVGLALIVGARGWGLFNLLALPAWVAVPLAVVVLDLAIYAQHVFHHVPARCGGCRYAPCRSRHRRDHRRALPSAGDAVVSLAIKMAALLVLGAPALAVVIFEVLLNAASMFNHSNVALPPRLDRLARWIVVTPQMHQVHHSIERAQTDSNFGFNLPWWDRLFGTYRAAPGRWQPGQQQQQSRPGRGSQQGC